MRSSVCYSIVLVVLGLFLIGTAYSTLESETKDEQISTLKKQVRLASRDFRKMKRLHQRLVAQKGNISAEMTQLKAKIIDLTEKASRSEDVSTALASAQDDLKKLEQENRLLDSKLRQTKKKFADQKKKKTYVKVHYYRPDRIYAGWGVHATGLAVMRSTAWSDPHPFKYIDDYGAYAKFPLHDDHTKVPLDFQIHKGALIDCDPDPNHGAVNQTKEILHADLSENKEIWLVSGIAKVFVSKESANEAIKQNGLDAMLDQSKVDELKLQISRLEAQNSQLKSVSPSMPEKVKLRVYYHRPDNDYFGWGLLVSGQAVAKANTTLDLIRFKRLTRFGAYADIELHPEDYKDNPVLFSVRSENNGTDVVRQADDGQGLMGAMHEIDATKHQKIYLVSGEGTVYLDKALAKEKKLSFALAQ